AILVRNNADGASVAAALVENNIPFVSWNNNDGDDKISLMDSLEAPSGMNPDAIVEKEEMSRIIAESIKELPEKEQKVLVLYYYEELTLKEIGRVLDVTESRVSQLHTKAIIRLRARLTNSRRGII
ncbi:MAG: sigma-70 family RNA polymerase sigma factor, partial [Spirochaetia bacterium]|nr:sigma-70 family RNA polymerase sigma factor [Spirochaetia bacterium]